MLGPRKLEQQTIMKKANQWILGAAMAGVLGMSADAAVLFSGTDGTLDFDADSGTFASGGVEVKVTASTGVVNGTSSGLGINGPDSGDATDGLDTLNVVEVLTFVFNKDVVFGALTLSGVGANDALGVQFAGGATSLLDSSGEHWFGTFLASGDAVTLTAVAPSAANPNNGVSITSFSVTAVPEPSAAMLGLAGGLGVLVRRRR